MSDPGGEYVRIGGDTVRITRNGLSLSQGIEYLNELRVPPGVGFRSEGDGIPMPSDTVARIMAEEVAQNQRERDVSEITNQRLQAMEAFIALSKGYRDREKSYADWLEGLDRILSPTRERVIGILSASGAGTYRAIDINRQAFGGGSEDDE